MIWWCRARNLERLIEEWAGIGLVGPTPIKLEMRADLIEVVGLSSALVK